MEQPGCDWVGCDQPGVVGIAIGDQSVWLCQDHRLRLVRNLIDDWWDDGGWPDWDELEAALCAAGLLD